MENIILKVISVLCIAAVAIATLFTNRNDEDVALVVLIFVIIALAIIFIPWKDAFLFMLNN